MISSMVLIVSRRLKTHTSTHFAWSATHFENLDEPKISYKTDVFTVVINLQWLITGKIINLNDKLNQ